MTSNTHDDDRAALVAGLRGLADFLEANPAVPVPASYHEHWISCLPGRGTDDEQRAFVDAFAAALGTEASDPDDFGHYGAEKAFGPVVYRSVAILSAAQARHDAENSYRDVIRLDEGPVAA